MSSREEAAPVFVLWLAEHPAPHDALARRGIRVSVAPGAMSATDVVALSPDLVVLASAARARELVAAQPSCPLSIALIERSATAPIPGRGGIVAHLDGALSSDALAGSIEAVLAALHASSTHSTLTRESDEIGRLVTELAGAGRAGVLLRGSPPGAIAIAGDGARAVSLAPGGTGTTSVRFYERAPGKLRVLGPTSDAASAKPSRLEGIAIVLVDDALRDWDGVVRALEGAGAKVAVTKAEPEAIEHARAADPALLIVPAPTLPTPAGRLVCEDSRLASAALLVIHADPRADLDPPRVLSAASELCASELAARARATAGAPSIERIEALGAVRWLRTFAHTGAPLRLRLRSMAGSGEIRLVDGKIRGATFTPRGGGEGGLTGGAAARALVAITHGTLLFAPLDAVPHERRVPHELAPRAIEEEDEEDDDDEVTMVAAAGELRELLAKAAPLAEAPRASSRPAKPALATPVVPARVTPVVPALDVPAALALDAPVVPAPDALSVASVPSTPTVDAAPPLPETIAAVVAPPIATSPPAPPRAKATGRIALYAVLGAGALLAAAYVVLVVAPSDAGAPGTASDPGASSGAVPTVHPPIAEPTIAIAVEPVPEIDPVAEPTTAEPAPIDPVVAEPTTAEPIVAEPTTAIEPIVAEPTTAIDPVVAEAAAEIEPVEDDPAAADALVARSDEAMRQQQYPLALELAEQALASDPRHARAAYDRGLALLRLRRDDEAVVWVERAVEWGPTEPLFRLLLGDIHQQNGRRARARAEWRACVEVEPLFAPCQRRLGTAEPTPPP